MAMTEKITIEYKKTDEWKAKIKETTAATISRKAKNVERQETTSPLY